MRYIALMLSLGGFVAVASAHHSTGGFYDPNQVVEIEGTVTSVSWRNPHTLITVSVLEENSEPVEWRIETGAISVLRSRGLAREFLHPGDQIKVAGDPSTRGRPDIFAHNILLEDGKEVLLTVFSEPRWTGGNSSQLLESVYSEAAAQRARQTADGIFRVWSTVLGDPDSFPMFKQDYPLTALARDARDDWDPKDTTQLGCPPLGMPLMMASPLPIEFVRKDNDILIRLEELDAERLIHMTADAIVPTEEFSLAGYATGRWEGDTFVVETTNIDYHRFDDEGTPQSKGIRLVERFAPSTDRGRLDYTLTITDPDTFMEPFDLSKYWVWRPEIEVEPYECDDRTEFYDE